MNELARGALGVLCYFGIAVILVMLVRLCFKVPDELFRKTLHFVMMFSYIPFVFGFDTWWVAVLFTLGLDVVFTINLAVLERLPAFSAITTERKMGELKRSNFLAFGMLAVCMSICWGLFGDRYLVLVCLYAWGVGDAFAALVGKAFGKHKLHIPFVDGNKSVEGSLAMFVTSAMAVLIVLLLRGGLTPVGYVLIPVIGAATATAVELISRDGMDTVTCPAAAMCTIIPAVAILGGFA